MVLSYLDDAGNEAHHLWELLHIDIEVVELIFQGLGRDDPGPLPDRPQTLQVSRRIQVWVRRLGEIDLGDLRGERSERRLRGRGVGGSCRTSIHGAGGEGAGWRLDAGAPGFDADLGLDGGEGRFGRDAFGGLVFSGKETHGGQVCVCICEGIAGFAAILAVQWAIGDGRQRD